MMPCEHGYYGLCPQCVREERDELRSRVVELERERDQLALSLSATRAERDHAVRSAELWESEHRAGYEAMGVYKHLWLEGRAIMAICGYFSRMRGPDEWCCVSKDGFTKRRVGTRQLAEMHSREGWTITPLYAGTAPVPAAQAVDVDAAIQTPVSKMSDAEFHVVSWVGSEDACIEAQTYGPREDALREAMRYAEQYATDACIVVIEQVEVARLGYPKGNYGPTTTQQAAQAEAKVADDVGGDEWSAVVRELMAVASYRPSCQKYVIERCRCFECVNERAVGLLSRNAAILSAAETEGRENE